MHRCSAVLWNTGWISRVFPGSINPKVLSSCMVLSHLETACNVEFPRFSRFRCCMIPVEELMPLYELYIVDLKLKGSPEDDLMHGWIGSIGDSGASADSVSGHRCHVVWRYYHHSILSCCEAQYAAQTPQCNSCRLSSDEPEQLQVVTYGRTEIFIFRNVGCARCW